MAKSSYRHVPRSWPLGDGRVANLESPDGAKRHWDSKYYGADTYWNRYDPARLQTEWGSFFMMCWFRLPSGSGTNDDNFMQISDSSLTSRYHRISHNFDEDNFAGFWTGRNVDPVHPSSKTLRSGDWHLGMYKARWTGSTWHHSLVTNKDAPTTSTKTANTTFTFDRMGIGWEGDSSPADELEGSIAHCAIGRSFPSDEQVRRLASGQNPLDVLGSWIDHYWPMTRETIKGHLNFDVVGGKTLRLTQEDNASVTTNLFDFRGSKPCPVRAPSLVIRRPLGFVAAAVGATNPGYYQSIGGWF